MCLCISFLWQGVVDKLAAGSTAETLTEPSVKAPAYQEFLTVRGVLTDYCHLRCGLGTTAFPSSVLACLSFSPFFVCFLLFALVCCFCRPLLQSLAQLAPVTTGVGTPSKADRDNNDRKKKVAFLVNQAKGKNSTPTGGAASLLRRGSNASPRVCDCLGCLLHT